MSKCAVVLEGQVVNIIVAEPTDTPPADCVLVLIPNYVFVNMGHTWDGENFFDLDGNVSLPIQPDAVEILEIEVFSEPITEFAYEEVTAEVIV
jgi:hypothetical protein